MIDPRSVLSTHAPRISTDPTAATAAAAAAAAVGAIIDTSDSSAVRRHSSASVSRYWPSLLLRPIARGEMLVN